MRASAQVQEEKTFYRNILACHVCQCKRGAASVTSRIRASAIEDLVA